MASRISKLIYGNTERLRLKLPSASFPVCLALCLIVALTTPRLLYRLKRLGGPAPHTGHTSQAILAGTGEASEIFLSALVRFTANPYRVVGLMTLSPRHTGRRIHGHDIMGSVVEADQMLTRLRESGTLPDLLIITSPELKGDPLAALLAAADRFGVRVLRTPRCALSGTRAGGHSRERGFSSLITSKLIAPAADLFYLGRMPPA